jgi:trk system potassium uptake protein TrkA
LGARKTLCLTNRSSFNTLVLSLGTDAVINPRAVTVSKIMQYIRKGRLHYVHSLGDDFGEVIDVDALHAPTLVGKTVQELFEEEKILVAGILREDVFMIPGLSTSIRPEDRVIVMMGAAEAKQSESILGVD